MQTLNLIVHFMANENLKAGLLAKKGSKFLNRDNIGLIKVVFVVSIELNAH